jgi:hypothetical protein
MSTPSRKKSIDHLRCQQFSSPGFDFPGQCQIFVFAKFGFIDIICNPEPMRSQHPSIGGNLNLSALQIALFGMLQFMDESDDSGFKRQPSVKFNSVSVPAKRAVIITKRLDLDFRLGIELDQSMVTGIVSDEASNGSKIVSHIGHRFHIVVILYNGAN